MRRYGVWLGQWDLDSRASAAAPFGRRSPEAANAPRIGHLRLAILYRALPAVTAVDPRTFGLVVVDGVHLDEIFELEFGQARGPVVIPTQLDTQLA